MTEIAAATATNRRLRRLASITSLTMALALVGIKVVAWALTGSMALLTAAVDGGLDVCTSAVTMIGVYYAARPEDLDHRYGHGKGETLAAFLQSVLLAGAGLALASQAIGQIFVPKELTALKAGVIMTLGSLIAVSCLVGLQSWVIAKTKSAAITADRQHYIADIVVNVGVLVSLGATWATGWDRVDPTIGLLLSLYMIWSAWNILRETLHALLDRELSEDDRGRIETTVRTCVGVCDLHDLRTRNAGDRLFIEFHLEIDGDLTINEGHVISDRVETAVLGLFPKAEVLTHLEPAGIDDERLDKRILAGLTPKSS